MIICDESWWHRGKDYLSEGRAMRCHPTWSGTNDKAAEADAVGCWAPLECSMYYLVHLKVLWLHLRSRGRVHDALPLLDRNHKRLTLAGPHPGDRIIDTASLTESTSPNHLLFGTVFTIVTETHSVLFGGHTYSYWRINPLISGAREFLAEAKKNLEGTLSVRPAVPNYFVPRVAPRSFSKHDH